MENNGKKLSDEFANLIRELEEQKAEGERKAKAHLELEAKLKAQEIVTELKGMLSRRENPWSYPPRDHFGISQSICKMVGVIVTEETGLRTSYMEDSFTPTWELKIHEPM